MPRIKQLSSKYAQEDFRKEIFQRLTERYDTVSVRALARETGMSQTVLNTKIRHKPEGISVEELRLIVPVLHPDPGIVLQLLGYTSADIRKFKNQKEEINNA